MCFYIQISHSWSLWSCLSHPITHFLSHPFSCIIPQSLQHLTPPLCPPSLFSSACSRFFSLLQLFFFYFKTTTQMWHDCYSRPSPPSTHLVKIVQHSLERKTHTHRHKKVSTEGQHSWGCLSNLKQTTVVWHQKKILLNTLSSGSLDSACVQCVCVHCKKSKYVLAVCGFLTPKLIFIIIKIKKETELRSEKWSQLPKRLLLLLTQTFERYKGSRYWNIHDKTNIDFQSSFQILGTVINITFLWKMAFK